MGKGQINVQDQFLNKVRKERIWVAVQLMTGQELEGYVVSFDNFSLILKRSTDQLIYKHAISCIFPRERPHQPEAFSETSTD